MPDTSELQAENAILKAEHEDMRLYAVTTDKRIKRVLAREKLQDAVIEAARPASGGMDFDWQLLKTKLADLDRNGGT